MAKKRFTDDLFELFEDTPSEETTDAVENTDEEAVAVRVPTPTPRSAARLSSKKFTRNLDAFLSESFEREERPPPPAARPTARRRRRTGLDYLIRSTVQEDNDNPPAARSSQRADTKRVTLIFNKEHLAILKEQAKERNMYLKDVVQEMVADYLAR